MLAAKIVAGPHICTRLHIAGDAPAVVLEPLYVVTDAKLRLVKCHTCKRWEDNPHVPTCHFARCPILAARARKQPPQRPSQDIGNGLGVGHGEAR